MVHKTDEGNPPEKGIIFGIKRFFSDFRENEKEFRSSDYGKVVYGSIIGGATFFGLGVLFKAIKGDKKKDE